MRVASSTGGAPPVVGRTQVILRMAVLERGRPARHEVGVALDERVGIFSKQPVHQCRVTVCRADRRLQRVLVLLDPPHLGQRAFATVGPRPLRVSCRSTVPDNNNESAATVDDLMGASIAFAARVGSKYSRRKAIFPPEARRKTSVFLFVDAPRGLDPSLAPDLRDGGLRVGEGVDARVKGPEILDGPHEPRGEVLDLHASATRAGWPRAGANGSSHTTSSASNVCQLALSATSVSRCRCNRLSATVMPPRRPRRTLHRPPWRRRLPRPRRRGLRFRRRTPQAMSPCAGLGRAGSRDGSCP